MYINKTLNGRRNGSKSRVGELQIAAVVLGGNPTDRQYRQCEGKGRITFRHPAYNLRGTNRASLIQVTLPCRQFGTLIDGIC
jgi:hypothetical protein